LDRDVLFAVIVFSFFFDFFQGNKQELVWDESLSLVFFSSALASFYLPGVYEGWLVLYATDANVIIFQYAFLFYLPLYLLCNLDGFVWSNSAFAQDSSGR
jgi:hypothetical protein